MTCPDLKDPARGFLQILQPNAPSRGLLMFFSGATGQRPWENAESAAASSFEHSIAQDGLEVVLVQWVDPWLDAAPGEQVGPGLLACRPATVVKWVHDTLYRALGLRPSGTVCGFCATGSSGGASQIAYALTWYGMGTLLQAAVMTGGPPHAQIAKGCLGIRPFSYGPHAHALDASYGYFGAGPCAAMETGFQSRWVRDSVDAPGVQLLFPNTRLVFIEGMRDSSSALPHALAFANEVKSAGSPFLQLYVLPEMDHEVAADPNGLQLLQQSVLAS